MLNFVERHYISTVTVNYQFFKITSSDYFLSPVTESFNAGKGDENDNVGIKVHQAFANDDIWVAIIEPLLVPSHLFWLGLGVHQSEYNNKIN